ncbi:LlaJI family restriction endonuclease [Cupriavidus pauculus]|uniref:LlaJI family restriction endonuclease n=1 Tax=Cupriavidus pauculus TaxID=82633 RepID=UPI001D0C62CC
MGVITVLEGTSLKMVEWANRLRINRGEVLDLIEAKILRADSDGVRFRLAFVGIVVFTNSLLFAQPKFGDVSPIGLSELLRILRAYFARSGLRRPSVDRMRDPEYGDGEILREFDALLGLRDWYFAHGIYRRDRGRISGYGRPHWAKTIAKRDPLLVQGSAVYPSIIAERREGALDDISSLQLGVLRHLLHRYGFEVPTSLVHAEEATGTTVFEWPLPDNQRNYHLRRLSTEQRNAFRTDMLHLFRLLRESLDSRLAGARPRLQIYGTTAFYAVWEDACRVALDGHASPDPATLVGQPVWWAFDPAGTKVKYEATQLPDIIVVRENWHIVVDAKYYYRFPQAHPGAPDIIKQFYYMDSLCASAEHVLSVFLLPVPGATAPAFLGYATIERAHRAFDRIEAWGIDPTLALTLYASHSTRSKDHWIDTILSQRKRVAEFAG